MEDQAKTNQELNEETVESKEVFNNDDQKIELFRVNMSLLDWEQWNFLFKSINRKSMRERGKYPKDYSLIINETIQ
ncbi:hypothetical protein [Ekhidna sp.]